MIHGLTPARQQLLQTIWSEQLLPLEQYSVTVKSCTDGTTITVTGDSISIALADDRMLARALTIAAGMAGKGDCTVAERPCYRDLGLMIDCSRGAVPTVDSLKKMLRILSRMGYTVVQLYMEDTFELPGYPYFGHQRGRYSRSQLRELDSYAAALGIELMPAVQTLAHMAQALRWPVFKPMIDTGDILLMEDEEVYKLIDAIFATLSDCFTSRRINIGMDEAHMLGLGKYLDKHGYRDRMELMLNHMERVRALAGKYSLQPMLWSDMFFRLVTGGDYYATDCVVDKRIAETIPQDTSLLYWDYYSEKTEIYDKMLQKHKEMTPNVIFAGGAWKWQGFSPNNGFSLKVAEPAHEACQKNGIREVLLTAWGDNGAECSLFAILPALQYWAELCYHGAPDEKLLAERFTASCGGDWQCFMQLDKPMLSPNIALPGRESVSPQRYALYQDLLEGLFDAHLDPDSYEAYYRETAAAMQQAGAQSASEWQYIFETQQQLCHLLALKCRCGNDLRAAYQLGDRETLRRYCSTVLPDLLTRLDRFVRTYHRQWLHENNAEGLITFDLRMGGLRQRVCTAMELLESYLKGELAAITELAPPVLSYDGEDHTADNIDLQAPFWHRIASPYDISTI